MNTDNVVTIKNLIDNGLNQYLNYNDQLVVSHVKDLSLFHIPCHLKATTILVCLNGSIDGNINLRKYHLEKYSVLINFPENIIQINNVSDLNAFAIIISSQFMDSLALQILSHAHYYMYEINKNETFVLPQHEIKNLSHFFYIFKNAISSSLTSSNEDYIKYLASAFVTNIIILHHTYHIETIEEDIHISKGNYMILDRFIELVGIYHNRERELQFYADKLCITPKYLSLIVKRVSGKKATDWICDFVILEAKSLLKYSGKNIQEVSMQLNFPTQSAFGKYFKCQVGMSPKEFIDNNQMF